MTSNTPEDAMTDVLVLAGVERAERHRKRVDPAGVPVWAALEHLGIRRRTKRARHVRARLDALAAEDALRLARRNGFPVWGLTSAGRRRLERARRAGKLLTLPEAPQHVAWRKARAAAGAEVDGFREAAGEAVVDASFLLEEARDGRPASSDEWFEIAERLQRACRRLGSASHCLYEWDEPCDEHADIDDCSQPGDEQLDPEARRRRRVRRPGRRNMRLWEDC